MSSTIKDIEQQLQSKVAILKSMKRTREPILKANRENLLESIKNNVNALLAIKNLPKARVVAILRDGGVDDVDMKKINKSLMDAPAAADAPESRPPSPALSQASMRTEQSPRRRTASAPSAVSTTPARGARVCRGAGKAVDYACGEPSKDKVVRLKGVRNSLAARGKLDYAAGMPSKGGKVRRKDKKPKS